ncbi:MAG: hypothetical protein AABZ06_04605 [Bdellovibrionota bacterium]
MITKYKTLIFFISLAICSAARADLAGEWVGYGTERIDPQGFLKGLIPVALKITRTNDNLIIEKTDGSGIFPPEYNTSDILLFGTYRLKRSEQKPEFQVCLGDNPVGKLVDRFLSISYYQFSFQGQIPILEITESANNSGVATLKYKVQNVNEQLVQDFEVDLLRLRPEVK